jgi:peptide/nickel transport system substrate-binding protein
MRKAPTAFLTAVALLLLLGGLVSIGRADDARVDHPHPGRRGGRLVVAQRAEPRTLNPLLALDMGSREVIGLMAADLIHIDRGSFQTIPALAQTWTLSKDGRLYTLHLRKGLRFSDGHPFDADDVLFTFRVHLDERVRSAQRELLTIGGKPITVRKLDSYTVQFETAEPRAAAERLFDSVGILPAHLLEKSYREGNLRAEWGLTASPSRIAGLGPFRLKEYVPGQRLTLERNPHYWKIDSDSRRLPYLDEIVFVFTGSENGQLLRFLSGEADVIAGLSPENFAAIKERRSERGFHWQDLGPGLEYTFLVFNQNNLSSTAFSSIQEKQEWFRRVAFRQAVSAAIDRDAIVRLVYRGVAAPLRAHVTEGNNLWVDSSIPRPIHSQEEGRRLLASAGFSWNSSNKLVDPANKEVTFSILTSAGNAQRGQIATIIQDDLKKLGITSFVVSLEFRAMMERVFNTYEYEAAVMTLASGDTDPNSEMNVWTKAGSTHIWNLNGAPAADWESEIDQLMRQQIETLNVSVRKRLYDRVQRLVAVNLPIIGIASPHLLVAVAGSVGNLRPSILPPYVLWNAEQLFWKQRANTKP